MVLIIQQSKNERFYIGYIILLYRIILVFLWIVNFNRLIWLNIKATAMAVSTVFLP
jgi:hypothetical protein